jgi:radical SAM superfamily enzyme YgiQ (UPF0313 family)
MRRKIRRNDPCPCGSGKKYKNCCGRPQGPARVLYLHPAKQEVDFDPQGHTVGRPYGLIPVGVAALVNVLRENRVRVKGLNVPLEKKLNPAFDLRRWLQQHRSARVVLIDLHWYEHAYGAISVARACKEALPEVWTVLGGLTASGFSREILENFNEVDLIVCGDAEKPLLALVQQLLGHNRRTHDRPDLSTIPNPSFRIGDTVVENERAYYAYCRDTQLAAPETRTEAHRGFSPSDPETRSLSKMTDIWDRARTGRESSWWPVPPGW